jgi:phosphogluconate dehydratase
VNDFERAGGPGLVLRGLIDGGFAHGDVRTVTGETLCSQCRKPTWKDGALSFEPAPARSLDESVVRSPAAPFSPTGGLQLLVGNLGRSVIKVSAVPQDRLVIEAPARVFDDQQSLQRAFEAGELERDFIAVVRFQGPRANGMPELHKLTPPLSVLQGKGFRVALVTDGRMSGASGKVPAAIHLSPEALGGGPLGRVRDGDILRLDAVQGRLDALVDPVEWEARPCAERSSEQAERDGHGLGRELFAGMRRNVSTAEEGAVTWL